uniref:Alpha/beta hydrolase fold n=1 Tax=Solibacter usitatus (strain Ellin6076) TaxID=234267 RepID=Q01S09_SOLUE
MARTLPKLCLLAAFALGSLFAQDDASHFTRLDGNRIHYLSFGEGDEAVVFIHGWTCDATFWKAQAPVYAKRRSLLIDLPGHGLSDKPEIAYTMELFARAVNAVLTDAKVRKATLVGHSMGAGVEVQVLRMYPAKIAGLMFVDGYVPQPPENDAERARGKAQIDGLIKALGAPDYRTFATRMIDSMFTKSTDPALKEQVRAKMLAAPQYVMTSAMTGMFAMAPLAESYPQVPAACIRVKQASSPAYREFLARHFQLVDFREFDDAGHFLMMEQPERFNSLLAQFLDRK